MKWLWLALLFCLAAPHAAGAEPDVERAGDAPQQVLLLLRLPAPHYRPDTGYAGAYGDGSSRGARKRIAAALARRHGLTLATDWPLPLLGVDCFVVDVPPTQRPEDAAELLSHDERVAWAQPMHVFHTQGHDDALFSVQPAARAWHLAELHELASGRGVRVAVIDSGIDDQHPDLLGQVALRENFVDGRPLVAELHGTAVAGIIAARADNRIGIVGVAPGATLLALRACWQQSAQATLCTSLGLAMALHFAIDHDAQVINLSLSGPPDRLLDKLLELALARSITVVAAFDRHLPGGGFPASHAGVVAVADEGEVLPHGALVAPGRDVPATLPGARWSFVSGSSYAAAHVAGLFALLRERLAAQAPPLSTTSVVSSTTGEIDACATLTRVAGAGACVRSMTRSTLPLARQ